MLVKTSGLVFHAFKYGESSLITEVYTRELGLRKYIVSGVRKAKARFPAGLFQVMTPLDLVVYHREDRDLNRVKEVRPLYVLHQTPFDIRRGAIALFMAEVCRKTVRESESNPELFSFLEESVLQIDRQSPPLGNLPLFFLAQLSGWLGFMPSGDFSAETPYFDLQEGAFTNEPVAHKHFLDEELAGPFYELLLSDRAQLADIPISSPQRKELMRHLLDYFRLHLDNFHDLQSPEVIRQVLE